VLLADVNGGWVGGVSGAEPVGVGRVWSLSGNYCCSYVKKLMVMAVFL
jgi:hypothetical protein